MRDVAHVKREADDTYSLVLGNQLIKGKRVALQRPLLVTQKDEALQTYHVVGLLHHKLLFNARPVVAKE